MGLELVNQLIDGFDQVKDKLAAPELFEEYRRGFRAELPVGFHALKNAKVEHDRLYNRVEMIADLCLRARRHLLTRDGPIDSIDHLDEAFFESVMPQFHRLMSRFPDCPSIPRLANGEAATSRMMVKFFGANLEACIPPAGADLAYLSGMLLKSLRFMSRLSEAAEWMLEVAKVERRAIIDALDEASDRRRKTGDAVRKPAKPPTKRGRKPRKASPAADPLKALPPSRVKAYCQHKEAIEALGGSATDREAYDWFAEHGEGELAESFESWSKYVRDARKALGQLRNTPRRGRETGRSIVRASDV
jgi:hypothetical protein